MCKAGDSLTIVYLSGGLGNQLFQYFDGACKSIESSESLILNFSQIHLGKISHGSTLRSIDLPVEYTSIDKDMSSFEIYWQKISLSLKYRIMRKLRIQDEDALHERSILNQNYLSYEIVTKEYPEWKPKLISPSSWFLELLEITKNTEFIALHLRQGDYLQHRNFTTIGVLSSEYYLEAIDAISKKMGPLPIWIFSDAKPEESFSKNFISDRFTWISPPVGTDPADSLMLMSRASGIILANSTFSWWAANFGNKSAEVFSPNPWFRNLNPPKNLIKSNWRKLPSMWMTRELHSDD